MPFVHLQAAVLVQERQYPHPASKADSVHSAPGLLICNPSVIWMCQTITAKNTQNDELHVQAKS